jgi:hypothetical protein
MESRASSPGWTGETPVPPTLNYQAVTALVRRWNVLRGRGRALAEEELFHLLHDDFLILLARGVQAIFVEQHLAVFRPLIPGFLRDLVVDSLSQVGAEGRLGERGQFLFQFCAEDFAI